MKRHSFLFILGTLFLVSCNPTTITYSFIYNPEGPNIEVAENMKRILENEYNVEIQLVEGMHTNANLDSMKSGKIDIGLIENYVPYQEGVNSVFSFYSEILHVFYKEEIDPQSFENLVYNNRIFIGRKNSPTYNLMMDLFDFYGVDSRQVSVSFNILDSDVIVLLSTLLTEHELKGFRDFRLFSFDDIAMYGTGGSSVEGISLKYPRIDSFVIPKGTYLDLTDEPIITLTIDVVMMVRSGMGAIAVTDLAKTMLRNRQTFAPIDPMLYSGMREDFDRSKLNFPLHEGARAFLDRDEPGFLERYAELGGVIFSIIIAFIGGIVSLTKWQAQKKKDKVDEFYEQLLKVKNTIPVIKTVKEGLQKIKEIQDSQNNAFEMLISEELIANDSFRIYMELSKETIADLRSRIRLIKSIEAKKA